MAQAAVDLSDPLQQPPAGEDTLAAAAHADDLLAQLAGEEIDRLLAEADAGRAPEQGESPEPPLPAPAASAPAVEEKPFVEIGKVLDDAIAPAPTVSEPVNPPPPAPTPPAETVEASTAAAERAALTTETLTNDQPASSDPFLLSLALKPLEWINAPLAACPQGVRELIGKAAIITLVNAVAVLIYVVIFRGR